MLLGVKGRDLALITDRLADLLSPHFLLLSREVSASLLLYQFPLLLLSIAGGR